MVLIAIFLYMLHWILVGFFIISFLYWIFGPSKHLAERRRKKKEEYLRTKYNLEK